MALVNLVYTVIVSTNTAVQVLLCVWKATCQFLLGEMQCSKCPQEMGLDGFITLVLKPLVAALG